MAVFTDILPPPQSVDSLDAWGSLDSLLWSLDSPVWNTAGKYGLDAEERAKSGQGGMEGWSRIRTDGAVFGCTVSGEAEGNVVLDLSLSGYASMSGEHVGGVARAIPVSPASGKAEEEVLFTRLREGLEKGEAHACMEASCVRIRTDGTISLCHGGADLVFWRARLLSGDGDAASGEAIFPEYKGWTWKRMESAGESGWAFLKGQEGSWTPIHEGKGTWRGAVQWQ